MLEIVNSAVEFLTVIENGLFWEFHKLTHNILFIDGAAAVYFIQIFSNESANIKHFTGVRSLKEQCLIWSSMFCLYNTH